MISETALYDMWFDATRRAGQPQCLYPQKDTLREFARAIWFEGFDDKVSPDSIPECPY